MNDKKKILIADDDPDILDVTRLILENYGGYTTMIVDRCESIFSLEDPLPDLILLDLWMAGYHGKDICKRLKNDQKTKNIPVILFSANRDLKEITASCGADDYLAKPFKMDELLAKVSNWL